MFEDARRLRGLARSLVAHAAADDLVQDTLIAGATADAPPSGPWLRGVMRNLARMRHREAARRQAREQAVELAAPAAGPDEQLHRMQVQRALCDAVLELPEIYRDVIIAHHLDGLTLAAIAKRERVPEGTIRWRHKEALDRLRAALDARSNGDRKAWLTALAPLGRLPAPAPALPAGKLLAIISVVIALAAVTLVVAIDRSTRAPGVARAGSNATAGSSARGVATPAPKLGSGSALASATDDRTAPDNGRMPLPPARYQLTVIGPAMVAVALGGGTSNSYQPGYVPPPPAPSGHGISGRVVDAAGHAIEGAVVVTGDRLQIMWGELTGEAGATTAADGSFKIDPAPDHDIAIIALHPGGWSPVTRVTARDGVQLVVPPSGAITGKVTYGGTPVQASLAVSPQGFDRVRFAFDSGIDGIYRFPLLAPGLYDVSAAPARGIGGGAGKREHATATVTPGTAVVQDFPLAEGVLIVVHGTPPTGKTAYIVDAFLLAGHHAIADHAALSAVIATLPKEGHDELLLGGVDATTPIQFHDRAPGPYTVCAELRFADTQVRSFGCEQIDLAAEPNVRELDIATH